MMLPGRSHPELPPALIAGLEHSARAHAAAVLPKLGALLEAECPTLDTGCLVTLVPYVAT